MLEHSLKLGRARLDGGSTVGLVTAVVVGRVMVLVLSGVVDEGCSFVVVTVVRMGPGAGERRVGTGFGIMK